MTDSKTFMDKGLEEIIREKGIEKPNFRKRKYRSSPNQKFENKNPNFQKRHQEVVTEDLRNRIGGKYSVLITGKYHMHHASKITFPYKSQSFRPSVLSPS